MRLLFCGTKLHVSFASSCNEGIHQESIQSSITPGKVTKYKKTLHTLIFRLDMA